jgi:molybdopterin-guanine dinucleotide biosynthesis protein
MVKKMYIETLDKPKIKVTKMICDEVIHEKLLEFPMIADCFSKNSYNIIVAPPGSGKTSLITSLVSSVFKKCFETIYVFIPEGSRMSLKNDIYGKHLPPEQLFNDLTEENIMQVYKNLQENAKEGENSLLIIDDLQVQLKKKDILATLEKIVCKYRHLRCTIFLLNQNFLKLSKDLRKLVSNIILINGLSKSELEKIFEEQINLPREKYQELINIAFQNKHEWVCFNLKSKRIYKMFDEIIIPNEEKDD